MHKIENKSLWKEEMSYDGDTGIWVEYFSTNNTRSSAIIFVVPGNTLFFLLGFPSAIKFSSMEWIL